MICVSTLLQAIFNINFAFQFRESPNRNTQGSSEDLNVKYRKLVSAHPRDSSGLTLILSSCTSSAASHQSTGKSDEYQECAPLEQAISSLNSYRHGVQGPGVQVPKPRAEACQPLQPVRQAEFTARLEPAHLGTPGRMCA